MKKYHPESTSLVIDDIRTYEGVVHARTSAEGIKMLVDYKWDYVLLDHDLGGDDTIKPVVHWLKAESASNPWANPYLLLITANPVGMQWIADTLRGQYAMNKFPGGLVPGYKILKNV